ncbi:auxin response factor 2B-like [Cornus florida]|uniref:auxin response factor 2B-like n=1 Tax=Cornus florida TaxID=4283 RepID=UPI00289A430A|nr:auxin response factor 2B-like [Cornus florida]
MFDQRCLCEKKASYVLKNCGHKEFREQCQTRKSIKDISVEVALDSSHHDDGDVIKFCVETPALFSASPEFFSSRIAMPLSFFSQTDCSVIWSNGVFGKKKAFGMSRVGKARYHFLPLGEKEDLNSKLWHICGGPMVNVPSAGDRVFYFAQGHIQQVEAYTNTNTNQFGETKMPTYNLPPKILCKVVNVHLKADASTDEVFAQITLLPEVKSFRSLAEREPSIKDGTSVSLPPSKISACSFSKKLTASDISTHGGFSVPKQLAEECFPPLSQETQTPTQDIVAKDLHGREWKFRHIYRGHPKRNLLNSGWGTFVSAKKLVVGDVCIFMRGGNGELYVGIRRVTKPQNNASASIISGHSMQHGILANALHAVTTGTKFIVYYHPWISPQFIIPYDQFMKCAEKTYSAGMRFRMQFEGEKEQRFSGTVVAIENIDDTRWPGSEWRCLKVKWDNNRLDTTSVGPERVSPWSIEPIELKRKKQISTLPHRKRSRPLDSSAPEFPARPGDGLLKSSVDYAPEKHFVVLQDQEIKAVGAHELVSSTQPSLPHLIPQPNADQGHMQIGLENQLRFQVYDPSYRYPGGIVSFPGKNPPMFVSHGTHENGEASRSLSVPNINFIGSMSQNWKSPKDKEEIEAPTAQPNGSKTCKLFGAEIYIGHQELPSPQVTSSSSSSSEIHSLCSVLYQTTISDPIQVSEPSESMSGNLHEKQCDKCSSTANWSYTKVLKFGSAFGRSINLAHFGGYHELTRELDYMLDFKGTLIDESSGWHVTYIDDVDDMMVIDDYPWQLSAKSIIAELYFLSGIPDHRTKAIRLSKRRCQ